MSQLLYHYCSSLAGFEILRSRSFWLSPLSSANDSLEGRVAGRVFHRLLQSTEMLPNIIEVASTVIEGFAESAEGFAFCLSESGDLLSQWRAYANDGTGISIGFDRDELVTDFGKINFGSQFYELIQVEYGEDALSDRLLPLAMELSGKLISFGDFAQLRHGVSRSEAARLLSDRTNDVRGIIQGSGPDARTAMEILMETVRPLRDKIFWTKSSTFHEENEFRLLRYRLRTHFNEVSYRHNNNSIAPYIICSIPASNQPIREIILGPKHPSHADWVRAFVESVGLKDIKVTRSSAMGYR